MRPRYPWKRWFAPHRRRLSLVRGTDYDCQPHSMAIQVRLHAPKFGRRVSVTIDEDTVTVELH